MDLDTAEIASLLKRERYHRDTAQWDLCREAFHPDGELTDIDVSWFKGNVDDFLRQSAKIHQGKVNIVHSSFDPVDIRVRGRRATSEAFCLISSSLTLEGVDYEMASYIRLVSRLQKLSDTGPWRLLSLEAIYVRDRLVCAFPGQDAASPLTMTDEVRAYPRCYRHMAFVMLHRGLKPRLDLPHEDDQQSVRRVLDKNRAYLEGEVLEDVVRIE